MKTRKKFSRHSRFVVKKTAFVYIKYHVLQFGWSIWHRWDHGRLHWAVVLVRLCRRVALWTGPALPSLSSRRTRRARRFQMDRRQAIRRTVSYAVHRPSPLTRFAPCDRRTSTSASLSTSSAVISTTACTTSSLPNDGIGHHLTAPA